MNLEGVSALIFAAQRGHAAAAAALLAGGADPEAKQRGGSMVGFAPLMIAAHQASGFVFSLSCSLSRLENVGIPVVGTSIPDLGTFCVHLCFWLTTRMF